MRRLIILAIALLLVAALVPTGTALAAKGGKNAGCVTIQDGTLTYSAGHYLAGQPLQTGYDPYGNNYQAHLFNGSYANNYLGSDGFPPYEGDDEAYLAENPGAATKWYWPYRDVQVGMKWSDIWLSNKSCDDDGLLDRGGPGGISSAAEGSWLTNHMSGVNDDGTHWTYFVKIVYPPGGVVDDLPVSSCVEDPDTGEVTCGDGYDDNTGGIIIWGSFIRIQQVSNDPAYDEHGLLFKVEPAGFGAYK